MKSKSKKAVRAAELTAVFVDRHYRIVAIGAPVRLDDIFFRLGEIAPRPACHDSRRASSA